MVASLTTGDVRAMFAASADVAKRGPPRRRQIWQLISRVTHRGFSVGRALSRAEMFLPCGINPVTNLLRHSLHFVISVLLNNLGFLLVDRASSDLAQLSTRSSSSSLACNGEAGDSIAE